MEAHINKTQTQKKRKERENMSLNRKSQMANSAAELTLSDDDSEPEDPRILLKRRAMEKKKGKN